MTLLNTVGQTEDVATGGAGDDTFETSGGGNILIGSAGLDTVRFATVAAASTIDFTTGQARQNAGVTVDASSSIENAIGGSGNDTYRRLHGGQCPVRSATARTVITGGDGDDAIDGGGGARYLSSVKRQRHNARGHL